MGEKTSKDEIQDNGVVNSNFVVTNKDIRPDAELKILLYIITAVLINRVSPPTEAVMVPMEGKQEKYEEKHTLWDTSEIDNEFRCLSEISLKCTGKVYKNVTLTSYYPDYNDQDHEHGYQDKQGKKLRTLQDYIDNRADFVTLAMDEIIGIPYGTKVCIPELNQHFGHRILIEVRDTSYDLSGSGFTRADICVRSEVDSYDKSVNRLVNLVFM